MSRKCLRCKAEIPKTRKRSAKYCSNVCAYEVKKDRSNQVYHRHKEPYKELKRNDDILSRIYPFKQAGTLLSFEELGKLGFNFGISSKELHKGKTWKVLVHYGYTIDTETQKIDICYMGLAK